MYPNNAKHGVRGCVCKTFTKCWCVPIMTVTLHSSRGPAAANTEVTGRGSRGPTVVLMFVFHIDKNWFRACYATILYIYKYMWGKSASH